MLEKLAYTFDRPPGTGTPLLVLSRFCVTDDGQLAHYTDDQLRAIVPPDGWDVYVDAWPDCEGVVRELRGGKANKSAMLDPFTPSPAPIQPAPYVPPYVPGEPLAPAPMYELNPKGPAPSYELKPVGRKKKK